MEPDLFSEICSYQNLERAFKKARKRKTKKHYVVDFEKNLKENLFRLRNELIFHIYNPKPLETFIIRDPKTRKISKSDFRDRIVHHALVNILEPIFDKDFIYDNFANRIDKGAFNAIARFDEFKAKGSKNNSRKCFVLKADIKHYFQTVDHEILLNIIKRKIKDSRVIWLIKKILGNYERERERCGMPLGNLTSQFFANVYLNEIDQFVKHKLKAKYYIRYVDDFVILHNSKEILEEYKNKINEFLKTELKLELHPDKSKILQLNSGIGFLGFRVFFYHKLIKKKNLYNFKRKFRKLFDDYSKGLKEKEKVIETLQGWLAYASHADTFKYRENIIKIFDEIFQEKYNRNCKILITEEKYYYIKDVGYQKIKSSHDKSLYLLKKKLTVKEIAVLRNVKEGSIWDHVAKLIKSNKLSAFDVVSKNKIFKITSKIKSKKDTLKEIKQRLNNIFITYHEINCVLAMMKSKNRNSPKAL